MRLFLNNTEFKYKTRVLFYEDGKQYRLFKVLFINHSGD